MAEDQKGKEKELSSDETAELEALLDTAGSDGAALPRRGLRENSSKFSRIKSSLCYLEAGLWYCSS